MLSKEDVARYHETGYLVADGLLDAAMIADARRVISDLTSEGGFPPFLIDPLDFAAVFAARRAQMAGEAGQA